MVNQTGSPAAPASLSPGLAGVGTALCGLPREEVCCVLLLALAAAAPTGEQVVGLLKQACEVHQLPVGRRWDLGQHLIQRLCQL